MESYIKEIEKIKSLLNKSQCKKAFATLQAIENPSPDILFHLGFMCENAITTKLDKEKASDYYMQAMNRGHVEAMYRLSCIQMDMADTIAASAVELLKMAADAGLADAKYELGTLYRNGKFVNEDMNMAIKLFEQAAELNHVGATFALNDLNKLELPFV